MITIAEIIQELIKAHEEKRDINLNHLKATLSSKYGLANTPKLVDIIAAVPLQYKKVLVPKLLAKPVRTASGIAVVAVMCKPHRCPHINFTGNICIYCPGGPDSDFEYSTQSYTGYEPTSMRAIRARYDPYLQVRHRIDQLKQLGHTCDKVEFIIMGGTFMSLPKDYRDDFIMNLHDALSGHRSSTVEEAVMYSERASSKCVGLTIETRPDYCMQSHLNDMLRYGCTRLEIGLQSVYEHVARDTNRGHTVAAVRETFKWAKDCGFKVVIHMMPNLPNVSLKNDISQFRELFDNPEYRPDGLKIYPTLVIRGTGLYELWKTGRYKSYPPSVLVDLIAKILALVPPWVRVYRVQRDIPMPLVSSGVEHGNLRELALERMADLGLKCRDVRTREVGISEIHTKRLPDKVEFVRRDYAANGGQESFLSYEDPYQDILVGLLRLRKCSKEYTFRPELLGGCSIVRELHVYGSVVAVSERDDKKYQHQGYGALLMYRAEKIAIEEHGSKKIAVISGVGTRQYYRKLGYHLEGVYMVKSLKKGEYVSAFELYEKSANITHCVLPPELKHLEGVPVGPIKGCDDEEMWLQYDLQHGNTRLLQKRDLYDPNMPFYEYQLKWEPEYKDLPEEEKEKLREQFRQEEEDMVNSMPFLSAYRPWLEEQIEAKKRERLHNEIIEAEDTTEHINMPKEQIGRAHV